MQHLVWISCAALAGLADALRVHHRASRSSPLTIVVLGDSHKEVYRERARMALRTWIPEATDAHIIVEDGLPEEDDADGLPGSPLASTTADVSFVRSECAVDEYVGLCCKMMEGFEVALRENPSAKWVALAVDDTYVDAGALSKVLAGHDADTDVYIGQESVCRSYGSAHPRVCPVGSDRDGVPHAAGGAGFVLSAPLLRKLLEKKDSFMPGCSPGNDITLGVFLRQQFGVRVTHSEHFTQEPRWGAVEQLSNCTGRRILPEVRETFLSTGDWGAPNPFVAQPFKNFAMMHSEPALWPTFVEMKKRDVFAFLDTGGRELVGPHYSDLVTLTTC